MSKFWMIALGILGLGIFCFGIMAIATINTYNGITRLDEECNKSWGNVENVYQRRYDLLPNLANVVERYAKHEQSTFTLLAEARAAATRPELKLDKGTLENPESLKKFEAAQANIGGIFGRLLSVQENYPTLKADSLFINLQHEIAGSENRISVERHRYNESVFELNSKIRSFWGSMINSFAGISKRTPFQAVAEANKAPVLMGVK